MNIDIDSLVGESITDTANTKNENHRIINQALIEAMCRGDEAAFRKVYLHSIGPLTDFLCILLQSKDEAEDAAQETFTYIWENRSKIDPQRNFKGYLYTVAKTTAFKQMARRKLDARFTDYALYHSSELDISPDEIVMSKELALLINIYFSNLPPQRRRAFEMSRKEGKSDKEIAQAMNLSINTVRMHIRLALKGLRELIAVTIFLFFS